MSPRKTFIATMVATALAAVAVVAQTTTTPPQGHHPGMRSHIRGQFLSQLNLTDAQKTQAKSIFSAARQESKPLVQQLQQERQAVNAAIQAGKPDSEVQQLASKEGGALGQLAAIRAKAKAQFFQTLTPEQRAKAAELHQQMKARWTGRHRAAGAGE